MVTGTGNFTGTKSLTFQIAKNSVAGAVVSYVSPSKYTGSAIKQYEIVSIGETILRSGTDYTVSYKNNKNVGTAKMIITGKGGYTGTKTVKFKITKASNPLYASAYSSTLKKASVKKKSATIKAIYISDAKGKVTYAKKSGSAKLSVNKSTGKVTVKRGTGKGTYSMKVAVKAAGNKNFKAATKTVTVKVRVR